MLIISLVGAASFVLLSILVAMHVTQPLDVAARDYFRPHDEWGDMQIRADMVVEGLKPRNTAVILAVIALLLSCRRSSWRAAGYAAAVAGAAGALTLAVKLLLHRPDPHNAMTAVGGSFPSGHTIGVLVCFGVVVLLLRERSRWWEWALVTLAGMGMGFCLLVQGAHWLTDVVASMLLGLTVLAVGGLSRLRKSPRTRGLTTSGSVRGGDRRTRR